MITVLYHGAVVVNDGWLLAMNILFTVLLVSIIACGVAAFFVFFDKDDIRKNRRIKERLKKLESVVENNETAQNKLEKSKDKLRRKLRKTRKEKLVEMGVYYGALTIVFLLILCVMVIPGWLDYSRKDYVEYEGAFECVKAGRNSHMSLADGTKTDGAYGLSEGEYYGTVVYSKRTKLTLGYSLADD